jgi:hypothetical protein
MKLRIIVTTACAVGLLCVNASASPLSGVFNLNGGLVLSPTGIAWTLPVAPFTLEKSLIQGAPTGSFSGMAGDVVTTHTVNFATEPVGVAFPPSSFLSFDTAPGLPSLDLTDIASGIYGSGQCFVQPPAVGQTCTPAAGPYTFLNLVNNPPPAPIGPQATMTFVLSGVTSDGLSDWQAIFVTQFTGPYQTILAELATGSVFSTTFGATVTVTARNVDPTPTPVPEPTSLGLVAVGLIGLVGRRRR